MNEAAEIAKDLKSKHAHAMKQEQQVYLLSRGIDPNSFLHEGLTSESDSTSYSESDISESTLSDSDSENETQFINSRIVENEPDERSIANSGNSSSEDNKQRNANIDINSSYLHVRYVKRDIF